MRRDEASTFGVQLGLVAESFGEVLSEARILLYFEDLADVPLDAVLAALRQSRLKRKYFPKVAEVREDIFGHPTDQAAHAWTRLLRAVESVGTGESVDFADPALHAAVETMGGWPEMYVLERLDSRELAFRRSEFSKLYLSFLSHPPERPLAVLLGAFALRNAETRGSWRRGLGYVDLMYQIGSDGRPQSASALTGGQRALPSAGASLVSRDGR